jgi:hypothetical protein
MTTFIIARNAFTESIRQPVVVVILPPSRSRTTTKSSSIWG